MPSEEFRSVYLGLCVELTFEEYLLWEEHFLSCLLFGGKVWT